MKKNIIILLLLSVFAVNLFSIDKSIEGLYLPKDEYMGIEVSIIEGGYLIEQVFIMDSVVKKKMEWQRAFVKYSENDILHFYWHTGRREDNDEESNGIIAYDLKITNKVLDGFYYFPENENENRFEIKYFKINL